jgi:CelD/BcsL family acetyltransferase involved in cellulose biosynthesis
MDKEPIEYVLQMFGVRVSEFLPGQTHVVAVDYMADKDVLKIAEANPEANRFVLARIRGDVGLGLPNRKALYKRASSHPSTSRKGKRPHPNNEYVKKQAQALKDKFGINKTREEVGVAACDFIATAESQRWPEIFERSIENLANRLSKEGQVVPSTEELRAKALKLRADRINDIISRR